MKYCDFDEVRNIQSLLENSNSETAQVRLDKYKEKYPRDLKILGLQLKIYNEKHDYESAYNYGTKYIHTYFSERFAYTLFVKEYAVALIHKDKKNQAEGLLLQAIKITEGQVPKLLKQLANLYIIQGNYQKALELYDMYTNPSNEISMNTNKVKLLYSMGEYSECIKLANELIKNDLDKQQKQKQYYYIGESYFKLKEYENEIINYKNATNIDNALCHSAKNAIIKANKLLDEIDSNNVIVYNKIDKQLARTNNNI